MPDNKIIEKKYGAKVCAAALVSVIIPAYNAADFIAETLDSVSRQTYQNYEIILVNDGSPDTEKLESVLEEYSEKIVYVKQLNGGTAAARNTGIENARGEFLAFLDGDDIWFADYLESQLSALKAKNCDLIYCDAELFGAVRGNEENFSDKSPSNGAVTAQSLIEATCNVITSGTFVKREKVVAVGMFDESLPRIGMEDFDLWFRLAKSGAKLDYQKKVLLKYRVRPNSLSGSNIQRAERNVTALDIINEKYSLNDTEKASFIRQREASVAELHVEKGKYNLTQENFSEARRNFLEANHYYQKFKFRILIWILTVAPKFGLTLFRKLRPSEFLFVAPNEK